MRCAGLTIVVGLLATASLLACVDERARHPSDAATHPLVSPAAPPSAKRSPSSAPLSAPNRPSTRAAASPASAASVSARPAPNAGVPIATIEVSDAIVLGDQLLTLPIDLLEVVAHSLGDGRVLWRTPFQERARGAHLLQRLRSGNVLVRSGGGLTVVEPRGGRIVHQHQLPMADRLHLWERHGACSLRGSCSVQLIDCETAAPLGKPIAGQRQHRTSLHTRRHHSGCWSFDVNLIGRVGGAILYFGHKLRDVGKNTLFAVDAKTGRSLWRSSAVSCRHCPSDQYGMSPDRKLCWGYGGEELTGFSCGSGAVRWQRKHPGLEHAFWAGDDRGGIFVRDEGGVALLERHHGVPRWRRSAVEGTVVLPERARLPRHVDIALGWDKPGRLVLLGLQKGEVVSEQVWHPSKSLANDAQGRVVVGDTPTDSDHTGQVRPSLSPPLVKVERFREAGSDRGPPNRATVRRAADGRVVDAIGFDAWELGEARIDGSAVAAVMVAATPRQVRLYRIAGGSGP